MRHLLPALLCLSTIALPGCGEEGAIRVRSIKFDGVRSIDAGRLKNALATREGSSVPIIGRLLPWTKKKLPFDRARFEADLERIKAYYADRGFPDASVASFDIKLNDKQTDVDVTLTIVEGEPVVVRAVEFESFEALPADRREYLEGHSGIALGKPRDRQIVAAAHEVAVNELRDQGYPYARVATAEALSPSGKESTITFTAEPGPESHFGAIEIVGAKSVTENEIRRQLRIKPGALYRRSLVQDSQRRLYALALFQFVNIENLNPEQQNPEVPMRVTIAEGRHQRVTGGVGYGTEEKGRIEGEYHHVNFLGGGRSAGAHGRFSSLDRGLRLDFTQPYFFHPTLSMGAEGQRWYTFTPAYESVVTGARLSFVARPTNKTSFTFSVSSERSNSSISPDVQNDPTLRNQLIALGLDPTTLTQEGTLSALGLDWQRSTTDRALDPRRGYQFIMHAEEAGHILPGTFSYVSGSADGRLYLPLTDRLVWANRVQLGAIAPSDSDPTRVPFSRKYFLGGATSVRGWGRYEISPLAGDGFPIGGNALLAWSSEARVGLVGRLGGVLFLDSGNVWADRSDIAFGDLRYAAGIGIRFNTDFIGPIRFDWGYQLNPIDGLLVNGEPQARRWRLHFSIGQAF